MFALIALLCFVLALAEVDFPLDLVVLGLAFVALHLMLPVPLAVWRRG